MIGYLTIAVGFCMLTGLISGGKATVIASIPPPVNLLA